MKSCTNYTKKSNQIINHKKTLIRQKTWLGSESRLMYMLSRFNKGDKGLTTYMFTYNITVLSCKVVYGVV